MKIYHQLSDFHPPDFSVVTSGTFDGVHLGHQKILQRLRELASRKGGETILLTYWPHPRLILQPEQSGLKILSTLTEKIKLLAELGIDHLIILPFTKELSQMSSQEFIREILVDKIQTKTLVIGYDHKFGKNREGSFEYLTQHSHLFGFSIEEISRQDVDDLAVSSTKIRTALSLGEISTANKYLGRPYSLSGQVVKGEQIGRSIGFPTANIQVKDEQKLLPCDGAYAVIVHVNSQPYPAILNIGDRPTVAGKVKTVEVHLLDFEGDLYGQELQVFFHEFLRKEKKFENLTALKNQLSMDRERAIFILKSSR